MDPDLEFRAYPVQASFVSGQVVSGPCVLGSVFQTQAPVAGTWALYDGFNPSGRLIMLGDGLGITEPMRCPLIDILLNNGLFFVSDGTRWTFLIAQL